MFYRFDQNNSGGYFITDDRVCHRLFIEADSEEEANEKAEELGCYWDGVYMEIDCPCCGDRWYGCDEVDLESFATDGYSVSIYDGMSRSAEQRWKENYGNYEIVEAPHWRNSGRFSSYEGKVKFRNVEEYAQFLANEYGWTTPDARIYYKDGTVKEIYSANMRR